MHIVTFTLCSCFFKDICKTAVQLRHKTKRRNLLHDRDQSKKLSMDRSKRVFREKSRLKTVVEQDDEISEQEKSTLTKYVLRLFFFFDNHPPSPRKPTMWNLLRSIACDISKTFERH